MGKTDKKIQLNDLEIAVIGLSGRFPGAKNIAEFWENLKNNRESISFYSEEQLEKVGIDPELIKNPNYVKAGGILNNKDLFDANFFGYTPKEAEIMHPQLRILHECTWEALEDAGYKTDTYEGLIGLYIGASSSFYWESLTYLSGKNEELGGFPSQFLVNKDFSSLQISYKLNLKGPSIIINTACSTSLVAIHLACRGLLSGECDIALAGGVSIGSGPNQGFLFQEDMIYSIDGHCRAFDTLARGTVKGEGIGIVVLKLLEDAIANRDTIYAVIKGTAINNDGNRKMGFSAPSINGQKEVLLSAWRMAEIQPETIRYIETHGTATPLGDAVEIEALKEAFYTNKKQVCYIGSVKTNIGHLDHASGVAGFIKTVMALKHHQLPPSLHFTTPNPKLNLENTPFVVNTEIQTWGGNQIPLRAGVSSFGMGGTNSHIVLEEAPQIIDKKANTSIKDYKLILLSAKTESALNQIQKNLAEFLKEHSDINISDMAYTLQVGRKYFSCRRTLVCANADEAIESLLSDNTRKIHSYLKKDVKTSIVFMFSGIGSQYVNMGYDLYKKEPKFREEIDKCSNLLNLLINVDIKLFLYPQKVKMDDKYGKTRNVEPIYQIEIAQLIIFIFEYALAKLLIYWGIEPRAMIGYSLGEYTAACISGIFSLEDALKVLVFRGQLIKKLDFGAMLSVPLPKKELQTVLDDELSIAIDNGASCVVAGTIVGINKLEKRMKELKCLCIRIPTSHAIHSEMMSIILDEFAVKMACITLNKPSIPFISNVTGTWISFKQAVSSSYWVSHLRETVRFADGLNKLIEVLGDEETVFIEIGPGHDLRSLLMRYLEKKENMHVVNLVKSKDTEISDDRYLLNAIGQLWLYGKEIDWSAFYLNEKRYRLSLPTYPFERMRYWIDGDPLKIGRKILSPGTDLKKKKDIADWFYIPQWVRSTKKVNLSSPLIKTESPYWMIFCDRTDFSATLVKRVIQEGVFVITVMEGESFFKDGDLEYRINPKYEENYHSLFSTLKKINRLPKKIIHLWSVDREIDKESDIQWIEDTQYKGFYSLIFLAKAIGKCGFINKIHINVVTNDLYEVVGSEIVHPQKSTVLGPIKVISQEYPYLICRNIDIHLPFIQLQQATPLVDQLYNEIAGDSKDPIIAYRNNHRWSQTFEPVQLKEASSVPTKLRQNSVYLITGGLGNIGFLLAEYLVKTFHAKLVLTGRTEIPPAEQWEYFLNSSSHMSNNYKKILKLQRLRELGGEILTFNVDVSDLMGMQRIITEAENRLGPIKGVIHTAGGTSKNIITTIEQLNEEVCREQFIPKIHGLLVLESIFKNKEIDFIYLTSSLAPVLGGLGFAAYSAANHFMDTFVYRYRKGSPIHWISVNWGDWQFKKKDQVGSHIGPSIDEFLMTPEEGLETFRRIISQFNGNQIVVSAGDLKSRFSKWVELESLRDENLKKKDIHYIHQKPALLSPYIKPSSPVEKVIVDIWCKLFGFEQIGIMDDFFELGGDSLKAITVISKIHKEFSVVVTLTEFFKYSTIKGLSKIVNENEKSTFISIEPVEDMDSYVLSSAQKRLYILQVMEKESTSYNETNVILLEGELDKEKLELTFWKLIARHESLRTSIHMIKNEICQKIYNIKQINFKIQYIDLLTKRLIINDSMLEKRLIQDFIKAFDLSLAPLIRVGLFKKEAKKYILIIDMHHIVTDGISSKIFINEFIDLFADRTLPSLRLQYRDYAEWQNKQRQKEYIKKQENYWKSQFKGEINTIQLPLDFSRPVMQSYEGKRIKFKIDKNETLKLNQMALAEGMTLYMVLLGIFSILLAKISNQDDIIIGTQVAGREHMDLQNIMGIFVNTIPLRTNVNEDMNFKEFLTEIKKNTIEAFENQNYQFEDLIEQIPIKRDLSRSPLVDVMFVLQNIDIETKSEQILDKIDLKLYPYQHEHTTSKFDLTLIGVEASKQLYFSFEYCSKLFLEKTIEKFIIYFKNILKVVIASPGVKIRSLEIITKEDTKRLVYKFNNTRLEYPLNMTVVQLLEKQVSRTPERIALVFPEFSNKKMVLSKRITYKELNKRANILAWNLRKKGVLPNEIVGVHLKRSIEMVIGLLGIIKSGCAYLPLGTEYPQDRLKYILEDSCLKYCITSENWPVQKKNIELIKMNSIFHENQRCPSDIENPPRFDSSNDLVYITYTSGSTGNPKGVLIENHSLVNLILGMNEILELTLNDNLLSLTTFSFDIFALEIYIPLTKGSRVTIGDQQAQLDSACTAMLIARENITVFQITPSHLIAQISNKNFYEELQKLKYLLVGGEVFPQFLLDKIKSLKNVKIFNLYGPTETTIWSTIMNVSKKEKLSIGKPISNTEIYILDKIGKLQLPEVQGELYISGDGLARGYLNQPEIASEHFLNNSHIQEREVLMYRSGDMAKWNPDGNIEFLGRRDDQIKLRGFRIELGEIEKRLLDHRLIKEAVVSLINGDDKCLCAYIVLYRSGISMTSSELLEIRMSLSKALPEYMVPSSFVILEKIPLTPNGKVDKKRLPAPQSSITIGKECEALNSDLEKTVRNIWRDILGIENLGIHDDFFIIGGNSLKLIKVYNQLNSLYPNYFKVQDLFDRRTIKTLADLIIEKKTIFENHDEKKEFTDIEF